MTMARNIVICCDGTNNLFGKENTNVDRLIESLERDMAEQLVYYDPGVGTFPEPVIWNPVDWLRAKVWKVADLAVGWGLEQNVQEAYSYPHEPFEARRSSIFVRVQPRCLYGPSARGHASRGWPLTGRER